MKPEDKAAKILEALEQPWHFDMPAEYQGKMAHPIRGDHRQSASSATGWILMIALALANVWIMGSQLSSDNMSKEEAEITAISEEYLPQTMYYN